jgi:hypothetical protein
MDTRSEISLLNKLTLMLEYLRRQPSATYSGFGMTLPADLQE